MNIAYFVNNFDYYSGAAMQAGKLAHILSKNNKIYILSKNTFKNMNKEYDLKENVKVINLPQNHFISLIIILKTMLLNNITVFHMHGFFTEALIIAKLFKRRVVLKTTLMGEDDFLSLSETNNFLKRSFKKKMLKEINLNIVLSQKAYEINSKFIDAKKVIKIPNGVMINEDNNDNNKKNNYFCIVGVISKRKRTFESIKYYIDNYIDLDDSKLFVVGPFDSKLGETDDIYTELCFKLSSGFINKKIFFTGNLKQSELIKIYKESKCLIFLSEKEGLPNVVLEAMSYNVTPIVTELDGVSKEIIDDEKDGFIIKNFNHKIDIQKIDHIMSESSPFKKVKLKYDIEKIAQEYESLYKRMGRGEITKA